MKKSLLTILFVCLCALCAYPQPAANWFRHLTYNDGLSDNKVNCILKSREGSVWIGTPHGLNRYDGFRVRSFYNKAGQNTSLPDNTILGLSEDAGGTLWVETASGFCLFNTADNRAERDMGKWMARHGMKGVPLRVATDNRRNLWIVSSADKLYYYDFSANKPYSMPLGKGIGGYRVSSISAYGGKAFMVADDGTVVTVCLSGKNIGVKHTDRYITQQANGQKGYYSSYADRRGGLWVWSSTCAAHYAHGKWRRMDNVIVSGVAENSDGQFIIATDHGGLLIADASGNIVRRIVNNPTDSRSLPDNTLQCVYIDDMGVTWIGMYRMGLASFFYGQSHFPLLPLGDVCTMAQSRDGNLWIGTNDDGIKRYAGGQLQAVASPLGSRVIVSSLAASDGSLWFGSFQGGLARIKNGTTTVYTQQKGGLANNNVWALAELPNGTVAIGTLGSGLQVWNDKAGRLTTVRQQLPSKYIASLSVLKKEWLAIGHSMGVTLLNLHTSNTINLGTDRRKDGSRLTSQYVIQVYADRRGLLWIATSTGLNVYDIAHDRLYTIDLNATQQQAEVDAVCEDRKGVMWLTSGNKLKSVSARRDGNDWHFFCNTYGSREGLQTRLFNKRSILCMNDGRVLVGGIDGVNVVSPSEARQRQVCSKVVFNGLALFDRPINVGDTINGHVLLTEELNNSRRLSLRHDENTFSILLASTAPGLPDGPLFMYRLKGQNKRWLITSADDPSVKFSNLSAGDYTLEVKPVDSEGKAMGDTALLEISVLPPFYLSAWAWIAYIAIAAGGIWYVVWRVRKNHRDEMEMLELRKQKELEEAKLVFFTNISHELRTPLTLIISPLESMVQNVGNKETLEKLRLMLRNARRLMTLTNQILDIRRIMQGKETLRMQDGDIVETVRGCCAQFGDLSDRGITLTMHARQATITTRFDRDKIQKIIANLLSNAYKFAPQNGRVDVVVGVSDNRQVCISVADNGPGISDEDKRHIFERFYQSKTNKQGGGSGIGLNLVWEYARMHGGSVTVGDNKDGGAVFTVDIPLGTTEKEKRQNAVTTGGGYVTSFASPVSTAASHTAEDAGKGNDTAATNTVKRNVLLVDDNDDFLAFLSSELSPYYNISTAPDGRQAMDCIRRARPDLVLTDVMMPVMDGNELCRCIKAEEELKSLPVVMLTARLSDENEIESRECGADDYVKKPFSLQLLRVRIDTLIAKNRLDDDGKVKPHISQTKITSEDEKLVDKVTQYIEQRIADPELSVEQMASDIGMSRVQLYRRLVSVTGKTPSELIRLVRLRHAERLLAESQLTVSEIAYKVGFSSQRYFSRCFKELFGYMPSEYKRNRL